MYTSSLRYQQPIVQPISQIQYRRGNYQQSQVQNSQIIKYKVPALAQSQNQQFVRYTSPYKPSQQQFQKQQNYSPIRQSIIVQNKPQVQITQIQAPIGLSRSLTPTSRQRRNDQSPSLVEKLFQDNIAQEEVEYELAYVPKNQVNNALEKIAENDNIAQSTIIPVNGLTSQIIPKNLIVSSKSPSPQHYDSLKQSLTFENENFQNNQLQLTKKPSYQSINEQIKNGNGSKFIIKKTNNKQLLIKPLLKNDQQPELQSQRTPKRQGINLVQDNNNFMDTAKKNYEMF